MAIENISRRDFLKWILGGVSSSILSGCQSVPYEMQMVKKPGTNVVAPRYFNLEDVVEANQLLIDFPDVISRAKSIDKYLTPGAKYLLVHVRDFHRTKDSVDEEPIATKEIQNNVYSILSHLMQNYGVDKVYCEGITPEAVSIWNLSARLNFISNNPDDKQILDDPKFKKWIPFGAVDLDKFRKENPELYKDHLYLQKWIEYGAVYRLASETGKLEILAAEEADALAHAQDMYNRLDLGFSKWFEERYESLNAIAENRENIFLNIGSNQESPLIVVVWGASHAWGGKLSCGKTYVSEERASICDNIAKWNSKNPDKKFSLIEITPYGI